MRSRNARDHDTSAARRNAGSGDRYQNSPPDHILRTKETLNRILAANSGKPYETICEDTERDNFMTAAQAAEYGLIDRVIDHRI